MLYALTFASLVTAVFAADLSVIPSCAQGCISAAVAAKTSCTATDVKCICASLETVTGEATPCVLDKCGLDVAIGMLPSYRTYLTYTSFSFFFFFVFFFSYPHTPFPPEQLSCTSI